MRPPSEFGLTPERLRYASCAPPQELSEASRLTGSGVGLTQQGLDLGWGAHRPEPPESLGEIEVRFMRPPSRALPGNPGFLQSLAGLGSQPLAKSRDRIHWLNPMGFCVRQNQRGSPVFPDYTPLVSVSGAVNPNCGASILQLTPSVPMSYRD